MFTLGEFENECCGLTLGIFEYESNVLTMDGFAYDCCVLTLTGFEFKCYMWTLGGLVNGVGKRKYCCNWCCNVTDGGLSCSLYLPISA